jgi:hypothetical protein
MNLLLKPKVIDDQGESFPPGSDPPTPRRRRYYQTEAQVLGLVLRNEDGPMHKHWKQN